MMSHIAKFESSKLDLKTTQQPPSKLILIIAPKKFVTILMCKYFGMVSFICTLNLLLILGENLLKIL